MRVQLTGSRGRLACCLFALAGSMGGCARDVRQSGPRGVAFAGYGQLLSAREEGGGEREEHEGREEHEERDDREERSNRLSVTVEQDLGIVIGESACSQAGQLQGGFACFRADQTQYHGSPALQDPGNPSGLLLATTRVLLAYDRVLAGHVTLGGRVGFVVRGGGPKPDGASAPAFLPFHGELRAAYWFGDAPFAGEGLRAGLFAAGGIAQVDSWWQVYVEEDKGAPVPVAQPGNPDSQTLDAYQKAGTGFAGGGLSLAYSFAPSSAVVLHLKVMELFPSNGTVVAPELGYELAF